MKILNLIILLLSLSSCSNWQYKEFTYLRCKKMEKIHVHLYYHETCDWVCLDLDDDYRIVVDTAKIKYKTDKEGKIKKVKLIK
jgi:hypothetical protein